MCLALPKSVCPALLPATGRRTTNGENQLTNIGGNSVSYDSNGNITKDDHGDTLVYDGGWHGDTNGDGTVNFTDLGRLIQYYGHTVAGGDAVGDVNHDGQVDFSDLGMLDQDYSHTASSVSWTVGERLVYSPYGVTTTLNPDFTVRSSGDYFAWNVGFQGMLFDSTTELNFTETRVYEASTGRFLTVDPARADGMNWYRGMEGNPINRDDPTGLLGQMMTVGEMGGNDPPSDLVEPPTGSESQIENWGIGAYQLLLYLRNVGDTFDSGDDIAMGAPNPLTSYRVVNYGASSEQAAMLTHIPDYSVAYKSFGIELQAKIEAWASKNPSASGKVSATGSYAGGAGVAFGQISDWARNMMMGGFSYHADTTAAVTTHCDGKGNIMIDADYTISWSVEKWYHFGAITGNSPLVPGAPGDTDMGYRTSPADYLMRVQWQGASHHSVWDFGAGK